MKKLISAVSLFLVISMLLSVPVFAEKLPGLSSSRYIKTRTLAASGRVYSADGKGWISAQADEVWIVGVDGSKLSVSYPLDSGGRRTRSFDAEYFTSANLSSDLPYVKLNVKVTTYQRPDGKISYGYIGAGDYVFKVAQQGDYTQIIYPLSNGQYKMAWCRTSEYDAAAEKGTAARNPFSSSLPALSADRPIYDGWYMVASKLDYNRVWDINGWSQDNGGNLEIYQKNNTTNQRFYFQYEGDGWYSIRVLHSGKYLHKANAGFWNDVHQWDGKGAWNTHWKIVDTGDGYYCLMNRMSGVIELSDADTSLGHNIGIGSYSGGDHQRWRFLSTSDGSDERKSLEDGWYVIESANNSNMVLDVNSYSKENGANLELYNKMYTPNQVFYLECQPDGYYTILSMNSYSYIHRDEGSANAVQWQGNGANNTQWALEPAGDGYFFIRSKSGDYLDNSGAETTPGNNVWTYPKNLTNAQRWKFISPLIWPTKSAYKITTLNFYNAYDRDYPTPHLVSQSYVNHDCTYGMDISGTACDIVAIADGTVTESGWREGGFGNCIAIQHNNGKVSFYAHLKSRSVSKGDQVTQGQKIGFMGNSGTKAVHLHFEYSGWQPFYLYRDIYKKDIQYGTNVYRANNYVRKNIKNYVDNKMLRSTYIKDVNDPIYNDICTWIEDDNYKVIDGWNTWCGK